MSFIALAVVLKPTNHRRLTIADGNHAHAAILNTITKADAVMGRALHDKQRHKGIALAIIERPQEPTLLRLTFMAQEGLEYAQLLMNAFACDGTLRIGRSTCDIIGVTTEQGIWSGVSTWADIVAPSEGRTLRFHFATPTAIAKRDEHDERFFSLFPEPMDVFSGLTRRWQALEGPPLPDDLPSFLQSGGCVVAKYELRTVEFHTQERTQLGFVGSVVYQCRKSSKPYLDALRALTRFASFTGVGYQTARGMGLVQTSISE